MYNVILYLIVIILVDCDKWSINDSINPNSSDSRIFDNSYVNYNTTTLTGNISGISDIVRNAQFNSTEIYIITNDSLFNNISQIFLQQQADTIKNNLCINLANSLQSTSESNLLSLFYPLLTNFENVFGRCNQNSTNFYNCTLNRYWNNTNQNGMDSITFQTYIFTLSYVLFPIFLAIIIIFTLFGFLNCMYFNYCYVFCFDYTTVKIKPVFFNILFFFVAFFSILYVIIGIFNEFRFSKLSDQRSYVMCQIINLNVYWMIKGIDISKLNNMQFDSKINWNGLGYLNSSFISYFDNVQNNLRQRIADSSYLGITDQAQNEYNALKDGLISFQNYINSTNFNHPDPNNQFIDAGNNPFNQTYICNKCLNFSNFSNIASKSNLIQVNEINIILVKQQEELNYFRNYTYNLFIDNNGWKNVWRMHNNTLFKIRESIYRSMKFYNQTMNWYNNFSGTFDFFHYTEIFFFLMNTLACIGGIAGYIMVNSAVTKANEFEVGDVYQFQDINERELTSVKYRWTFHLVIFLNIFTSLLLCIYCVYLLLLAVYSYEIAQTTKLEFYNNITNKFMIKNFSFISNGFLTDYCQETKDLGPLYNLTDYNLFYLYMVKYLTNMRDKYANDFGTPNCDSFNNAVGNLNLTDFRDITNNTIYWDPNDEQIKYFLDFLTSNNTYKFFNRPSTVLRQYTDYSYFPFNPSTNLPYINYQNICRNSTMTMDKWVSNQSNCQDNYKNISIYNNLIDSSNKPTCISIDIGVISTNCPSGCNDIECYLGVFIQRYTATVVFPCAPNDTIYLNQMKNILRGAKTASCTKYKFQSQINDLQQQFNSLIWRPLNAYKTKLKNIYTEYISFINDFKSLAEQFSTNSPSPASGVDKNGLLKISNCGYVNDNYYAFHYMTNDISQELFGIALTTLGLSIFLFINGSLVVVAFFKLRTYREIENIKWVKETIKQIENKDLRFFFRANNYIDSEDYKKYNELNFEGLNAEDSTNKKNATNENEAKIQKNPYKKNEKQEDIIIDQQKKQFEEEKERERKKYNIIYDFIDVYNNYLDQEQKKIHQEIPKTLKENEKQESSPQENENSSNNDLANEIQKQKENSITDKKNREITKLSKIENTIAKDSNIKNNEEVKKTVNFKKNDVIEENNASKEDNKSQNKIDDLIKQIPHNKRRLAKNQKTENSETIDKSSLKKNSKFSSSIVVSREKNEEKSLNSFIKEDMSPEKK